MKETKGTTPEGKINTKTTEDLNSVEVSRNTRGYNWTIKMYSNKGSELPAKINGIDKRLRGFFKEKKEKK